MKNLREASRDDYNPPSPYPQKAPSLNDINTGCMQRIADALEIITDNYTRLLLDRDIFRKQRDEHYQTIKDLKRQIAKQKALIKKLTKGIAK